MFEDIIGVKEEGQHCILKTGELWTECPNFKQGTSRGQLQCKFAKIVVIDHVPEFLCEK